MCLYPASIPNVTGCFVSPVAYRSCIVNGFENATGETKQPVTLGIDAGYKHIGFSAVTEKRELVSGEAVTRTDIPKLNNNIGYWKYFFQFLNQSYVSL